MTFDEQLKTLGFTKSSFARHCGIAPETVTRWGGQPPQIYKMYLSLLGEYFSFGDHLRDLVASRSNRILREILNKE